MSAFLAAVFFCPCGRTGIRIGLESDMAEIAAYARRRAGQTIGASHAKGGGKMEMPRDLFMKVFKKFEMEPQYLLIAARPERSVP